MRALCLLIMISLLGCNVVVGTVPLDDPRRETGGLIVGPLEVTERLGRRNTIWYCLGGPENLRAHLDRNVPVRAVNGQQAQAMLIRQATTRSSPYCGWRTTINASFRSAGTYQGLGFFAVYFDGTGTPIGYTVYPEY